MWESHNKDRIVLGPSAIEISYLMRRCVTHCAEPGGNIVTLDECSYVVQLSLWERPYQFYISDSRLRVVVHFVAHFHHNAPLWRRVTRHCLAIARSQLI